MTEEYSMEYTKEDELYDRIEELEKEVVRLRNENLDIINKYTRFAETDRKTIAELEAQIEGKENEFRYFSNSFKKKIAELEEENAELKDDNKVMADNYSKMEQKFYDNLTKAKEIIKGLLISFDKNGLLLDGFESSLKIIKKAEDFIKG